MKLKRILLYSLIWMCHVPVYAQTSKEEMFSTIEKTGGVYLAYPLDFAPQAKAPKGYKPFYVSHYGRHGSRYLIADHDYKWLVELFEDAYRAGFLSTLGEDTYRRLLKVWEEAEGHGGDLTPLGVRQQRGIAERMYASFPEAFKGSSTISARSTVVLRCAMSMVAFGDRLKELNPELRISYEASPKHMDYLNYHTDASNRFTSSHNGPWVEEYRKFEESHTQPDRLIASLFRDKHFIRKKVNPKEVMWGLYWIAVDMQNAETKVSFYDIFEPQELFDLWQCVNYRFYVGNANHAEGKGIVVANAKSLLQNMLDSADEAIRQKGIAATLRFGHDGNVIPLAALMHIENCNVAVSDPYEVYKVWSDFKVVPMAANIQMVFFRNEKRETDDILVKFLHNENEVHIPVHTDIFPFYKWNDVESYYRNLLK
ncbi:histidine-type phosphatase [Bacteroides heparinolyticus]|uniref:Multiple inositol polyphosphate phosphatase 1 n=1 Tax=Prevotella heparinolytica TaxID=28113 RepID=A0A3P2A388_9BACE|nr:histidine-type phosphatase [Bacteroides heparinolyticus]RRD89356.1 histidine-type phosphatase [Bacteroides heparinolyticus]